MPMGQNVPGLQAQSGQWLDAARIAQEKEMFMRNHLLQRQQNLSEAMIGLVSSLAGYQQQKAQAELAGQEMALKEQQVENETMNTVSMVADRALSGGKTRAETQILLKELGYKDQEIQGALGLQAAQTAGVQANTDATLTETGMKRQAQPGAMDRQAKENALLGKQGQMMTEQITGEQLKNTALRLANENNPEAWAAETERVKAQTALINAQTITEGFQQDYLTAQSTSRTTGKPIDYGELNARIDQREASLTSQLTAITTSLSDDTIKEAISRQSGITGAAQWRRALEEQRAATYDALAALTKIREQVALMDPAMQQQQAERALGEMFGGKMPGAKPDAADAAGAENRYGPPPGGQKP